MKKTPNTKNNYPVILMHGAAGWGDDDLIAKVAPYYGFFKSNIEKMYRDLGYECYAPGGGPISGTWARACDLYAQLVGGTTDFGKVFSEEHGTARYGRTYPGLIKDWGTLDENGKRKKIVLISHSFGTPAMHIFLSLLANGSEAERAGTPEDELSDLFKGGKADWVHASTTLAGVHNGLSLVQFFPNGLLRPLWGVLAFLLGVIDDPAICKKIWDIRLDQYGLMSPPGQPMTSLKQKLHGAKLFGQEKFNSIAWETCFEGAAENAKNFPYPDNVYYFAHCGNAMAKTKNHYNYVPVKKSYMFSRIPSYATGAVKRPSVGLTDEWLPCDGLVPVMSARAPLGEPQEDFVSVDQCKPGIWYKMPIEVKDHHSFEGSGEDPKVYQAFMKEVLERMENCPATS